MSENITRETDASVEEFLDNVEHPGRREDSYVLLDLMRRVTGVEPKMWGPAIIGFGKYRYRYESGREGEMLRVGFSPRKANLALYLLAKGVNFDELRARLGKHKDWRVVSLHRQIEEHRSEYPRVAGGNLVGPSTRNPRRAGVADRAGLVCANPPKGRAFAVPHSRYLGSQCPSAMGATGAVAIVAQ